MASLTHFLKNITKKHNKLTHTLKHYTYFLSTHPHPSPPVAKKVPYNVTTAHGATLQDPYHWMSDTHDQDFVNYIKNENSYAEGFMKDTMNVQSGLFNEMVKRLPELCAALAVKAGRNQCRYGLVVPLWLYYQYIPESKEYPVLCRKPAVESTNWVKHVINYARKGFVNEEILLDWNEIAKEHGYVHVGTCRVSPNHHFLAYTIDITGEERFILQVKDLQSGTTIPTLRIEDVVYIIDANKPKDGLLKVHDRVSGVQFFLEHHKGFFYILKNAHSYDENDLLDGNYYLARCPVEDIQSANWQKIIVPAKGTGIQDMDVFDEHLVLYLNGKDSPIISSIKMPIQSNNEKEMDIDDLDPWYFSMPSNSCSVVPGSNHDFMSSVYRVVLSSPVMPDLIVDYDMSKRTFSVVHQEEVLGISSKANSNDVREWLSVSDSYSCERKEVVSHDGTIVPLTILYSHKAHKMGQSCGIIHGYGSYGEVLDKSWSAERLSLLDRGWVVAFADVRGGGGADPSWHKSGSGLNKLNSINDFISCGNYLISEGYVHQDQLFAIGHSAGGLLVAAAINMHPKLFRAAILKVPFLDICNTLLDPNLPLTVLDYEEFGNPQIKSDFDSIMKYSPYDNIRKHICYPAMLVTSSYHDSRVGVWEAAKYVARIRESTCSKCSRSVILRTNMTGGHFGEGGRSGQCEELAYEYAFLMKVMGQARCK
ncbi:hypothetical protein CTI12_AA114330 [Artemisia annua]|uniref:Prolyl endopeptidase n=1 Tax=Artemisia annua TaxID=35608 RepID=A0A2U1PTF6_ARTAN|nr:hypothetical protein CTI12_AA114330 [Artemisia annua]